jgi:hypothetical protein
MGKSKYHDNSWSAEATLAAIAFCNSFLGRMWLLDIPYPLDRYNMLPINAYKGCKTCVDRGMIDFLGGRIVL